MILSTLPVLSGQTIRGARARDTVVRGEECPAARVGAVVYQRCGGVYYERVTTGDRVVGLQGPRPSYPCGGRTMQRNPT